MKCCKFYIASSTCNELIQGYILPMIESHKRLYISQGYTIELYSKMDKNGCIALLRCNNNVFIQLMINKLHYHTFCDDDINLAEYKPVAGGSKGKPIPIQ